MNAIGLGLGLGFEDGGQGGFSALYTEFDGSNDYILHNSGNLLASTYNRVTAALPFEPAALAGNMQLFNNSGQMLIRCATYDGGVTYRVNARAAAGGSETGSFDVTHDIPLTAGQHYFLLLSADFSGGKTVVTLKVNGVESTTDQAARTTGNFNGVWPFAFGATYNGNGRLNGCLGPVWIKTGVYTTDDNLFFDFAQDDPFVVRDWSSLPLGAPEVFIRDFLELNQDNHIVNHGSGLDLQTIVGDPTQGDPARCTYIPNALPVAMQWSSNEDSITVSGYSVHPQDIVLEVEGQAPQTITPTAVGTDGLGAPFDSFGEPGDHGAAGIYIAQHTFTGLTADTVYYAQAAQNGSARRGDARTKGASQFKGFMVACDAHKTSQEYVTDDGCYTYIRQVAETSPDPVLFLYRGGDSGYIDNMEIDDRGAGGTGAWLIGRVDGNNTIYARAKGYAAYLGLLQTDQKDNGYLLYNRSRHRIWCMEHLDNRWGMSDHDAATNNPEEQAAPNLTQIANGVAAFEQVIGVNMPFIDTVNSAAWVDHIGPLELIHYDRCSGITKQCFANDATQAAQNGRMLGSAQIADIHGAVDAVSPFKLILMTTDLYPMMSQAAAQVAWQQGYKQGDMGTQQPLGQYTNENPDGVSGDNEADQLFREKPNGIAVQASAYGGVLYGLHDDVHHMREHHYTKPDTPTHGALDMIASSCGSVNARKQQRMHPDTVWPAEFNGTTIPWHNDSVVHDATSPQIATNTCLEVDVGPDTGKTRLTTKYIECLNTKNPLSYVVRRSISQLSNI